MLTLFLYWMVWWYPFLLVDVSSYVLALLPLKQPYPLLAYESSKDMTTQATTVATALHSKVTTHKAIFWTKKIGVW